METGLSASKRPKVRLHGVKQIRISGDYIRLDALLKYSSVASTGGEAKIMIQNGAVLVGNEPCTERGKKIRQGDIVRCGENTLLIKQK